MGIQKVKETEWVLCLTPLLSGKARTVCTNLVPTTGYDGVKKAFLEHYNINSERCWWQFRALAWTKDQEPAEWITKGMELLKRWLLSEKGVDTSDIKLLSTTVCDAPLSICILWTSCPLCLDSLNREGT